MDFNGGNQPTGFDNLLPDRTEMECEELFAEADKLLNDGVIMDAVDKLSTILKRNPRFGKAYNHLGWVYETKYKNVARAEEYYKAAMQFAPHYTAPFLNYCYFLSNQNRYQELKAHLDRMSQISGIAKDTIANEYAIMYEMQGDLQTAIDYYQKAAIVTLDNSKLDRYKEGVDRCRKKLEILNPSARILRMIRLILEKSRYLSIISVLGMLFGAVAAMILGVIKMFEVITLAFSKNDKAEALLYLLFESLDSFLVATALFVIATSLYELFIGELDVPNWMLVKDLTELKSKFTFVIIPVMAVKFVQKILNYENAIDTFYYGAAVGIVTLALAAFNFVNLKEKEEHFIEEQTGNSGKKEVRSEDLKKK